MTTVACNLKEMAADRLVTAGTDWWHAVKLHRLDDGSVCGVAGDSGADLLVQWLKRGGRAGEEPDVREKDFYVMHLTHHGIYLYCGSTVPDKLTATCHAIGSGGKVAMYALKKLKASPEEAVKAAAEMDLFTGGPIDVMRLE